MGACQSGVGILREEWRQERDPHGRPRIVAGHLDDPADVEPLVHGVQIMRRIFATKPLADDVAVEMRPGKKVDDDESMRAFVHATADSAYHAVGTCALGMADASVTTPDLRVRGVVLTMFDPRTNLSTDVVQEVNNHFPGQVFKSIIPRSIRLAEAPSYGLPISAYAPSSVGAKAYEALARELLKSDGK